MNCRCPELNTIVESNQPHQGVSMNENGVVEQGQLRTVHETTFGGVETNAFRSIYQLKKFLNKFSDTLGFVIKFY